MDLTLVGSETAGTVVAGMLGPKGKGCPAEELTLQPQDTAAVSVTIHGTGSYIYHGMLVLQQDVGNGRLTDYPLASTATALDLAQESQFSCENISSGTTTAVKLGPVTPFSGIDCV